MTGKIYALDADNRLRKLTRAAFSSEDIFQKLLADHPTILDAVADNHPPLLIGREQAVYDGQLTSGRWSLDHLYVDRSGVPILVEVKRAQDTRARREVVAQMLDYAANGIAYWPMEAIIGAFDTTCRSRGQESDRVLSEFLGQEEDGETFWRSVEANLRAGRIRMVFVADEVSKELRRIVEFLNEQMRTAEVLAVQLEQFTGQEGARMLVPKLFGETERASATKSVTDRGPPMSLEEWLSVLAEKHGADARRGAEKAVAWFGSVGAEVGVSKSNDSIFVRRETDDGKWAWCFFIRSNARLETALIYLQYRPAFASPEARKALLQDLLAAKALKAASTGSLTGTPSFPVTELLSDDAWNAFQRIGQRVIADAQRAT